MKVKSANCATRETKLKKICQSPSLNASDATCQAAAVCATCGYTYEINPENHAGTATKLVNNGNGTHKVLYTCCEAEAETVDCVFADDADMVCDCGYDRTVVVTENGFANAFDNTFNGGANDYVADAPAGDAFDGSAAVAGTKVDIYYGFNLELVSKDADYVILRHYLVLNGTETVMVNGAEVVPTNISGNYYYIDVEVNVGDFAIAHTVTVDGETVVTASVYSYMKTAFEAEAKNPDTMTDPQENLLKALYQWDKAVAEAK